MANQTQSIIYLIYIGKYVGQWVCPTHGTYFFAIKKTKKREKGNILMCISTNWNSEEFANSNGGQGSFVTPPNKVNYFHHIQHGLYIP